MIERNIYFESRMPFEPIRLVEGSSGQEVVFNVMDITIKSGATAKVISITPNNGTKTVNCTCSTNGTIKFNTVSGLFFEGKNILIIELKNGSDTSGYTVVLYSYEMLVNCEHNFFNDTTSDAQSVASAMVRAETAAHNAVADALNTWQNSVPALGTADISNIGDGTFKGSVKRIFDRSRVTTYYRGSDITTDLSLSTTEKAIEFSQRYASGTPFPLTNSKKYINCTGTTRVKVSGIVAAHGMKAGDWLYAKIYLCDDSTGDPRQELLYGLACADSSGYAMISLPACVSPYLSDGTRLIAMYVKTYGTAQGTVRKGTNWETQLTVEDLVQG